MANDVQLTNEQRIWLINRVINAKGLYGLLDEIATEFKTTTIPGRHEGEEVLPKITDDMITNYSEKQPTNNNESINNNEPSIYREGAKALVEQDKLNHPVVQGKETVNKIEPVVPQETETIYDEVPEVEKTKVLEKRPNNNPWSGIETVSPGQLKL